MGMYDGHGTTVTFGTSGLTFKLIKLDGPTVEVDDIEITTMASVNYREYTPADLKNPGEMSGTWEFFGSETIPIGGAVEPLTINWGGVGAGYKWTGNGYIKSAKVGAEIGARRTLDMTIKFSGEIKTAQS